MSFPITPTLATSTNSQCNKSYSGQVNYEYDTNNKQGQAFSAININQANENLDEADRVFNSVKNKFSKYAWGTALVSGLGLLPFILNYGLKVPAKALQIVGDLFGSFAAVSGPFALITNEIKNHKKLTGESNGNNTNGEIFDRIREAFYRCCSLGFTPFIFEPFINPEKFGKSIFHKIATFTNIPNLLFTGFAWGFGNFQALLAWGLRDRESIKAKTISDESEKIACEAREKGFNRIYASAKRLATLGSIANPTMQGLRQSADSLAFIFGQMSKEEFFERPLLGISRLVSLFVGIPEYFIKGVDSIVRITDESKHLEPVLPEYLNNLIKGLRNKLEPQLNTEKNTALKSIRHKAEILFHTLSPLSMFALFTPMLDESYTSEEAESRGGIAGILDKTIGRIGKALTIIFTGSYVLFARLPQTMIQTAFYGKKLIDKYFNKKETTTEELEELLKNKIANNSLVSGISGLARRCIDFLVENYYTAEHQHRHLTFEQVVAHDSFAQAKETYKKVIDQAIKEKNIDQSLENEIIEYCLKYAREDALKSYHNLTDKECSDIKGIISQKIKETINPQILHGVNKPKVKPRFPGAYFLATYIFRLFNIKDRILDTDFTSDYRNMKTVYKREELDYSFEGELLPVFSETVQGLRRTVNLVQGITG